MLFRFDVLLIHVVTLENAAAWFTIDDAMKVWACCIRRCALVEDIGAIFHLVPKSQGRKRDKIERENEST